MIRKCVLTATVLLAACLYGCGLAETAVTTAAQGTAAAEQAKQGKALEAKVRQDLEAAQLAAKQQIDDAEAAAMSSN